jgi:hypothetical protein
LCRDWTVDTAPQQADTCDNRCSKLVIKEDKRYRRHERMRDVGNPRGEEMQKKCRRSNSFRRYERIRGDKRR